MLIEFAALAPFHVFFFQAEDGIRDLTVTGVQTCALPISIDQGSAGAAERLLAQVSLRYVDADQILLERARQTMDRRVAGPRTAARVEEILQPIVGGQVRADIAAAHLIAGDAQLAAGAKEKARSHWRAAWIEHPLSPAADTARDRERQLGPGGHIAPILLGRRGGRGPRVPPHPPGGGPPSPPPVALPSPPGW